MPKISVILSSYNHADFIAEAIASVLNQTFQDFELLIFDDGSKDGSADVIRSFQDPRIKTFLYEENLGPRDAAREAFAAAKGEYIAVHHSDDAWEPSKLEKQVQFLDEHPEYAACFTLVKYMDENSEEYVPPEGSFYRTVFRQPNRTRAQWLRHFFFHGNCLCHPSLLIRREKYAAYGLLEEPGLWQLPDFCMWVKLAFHEPFYIYQEELTRFRLRRGTQTQQGGERADVSIRSQFELYQILLQYRGIRERSFLLEVFPETKEYLSEKSGSVPFALAMVAKQVGTSAYQMLALEILFALLRDAEAAQELERCHHYTWRDFVRDTGSMDVFHTSSILQFLSLQLHLDYADGGSLDLIDPRVYVSASGAFHAEFRAGEDGREIRELRVGIRDCFFSKIAMEEISCNRLPAKFAPLHRKGRDGAYDVFHTVNPQYEVICRETGEILLQVSGLLDLGSKMDLTDLFNEQAREMEAEIERLAAVLAAKEDECRSLSDTLEVRDKEIEAIKATLGWRVLQRLRDVRDNAKGKAKSSAYACMASPAAKKMARSAGASLQKWSPALYEKAYLPLLAKAKQEILSYSAGTGKLLKGEGIPFWKSSGERPSVRRMVSIIVPNYNHGAYLRERLDSIYRQTYEDYEVILLDDCSTDDSRDILQEYQERYPERTRLAFNENNSGNVFAQWKKGMSLARGELIWIAESDDWCEEGFLAAMVKGFDDEAVMLAFCRSDFMQDGVRTFTTEDYLRDLAGIDWTRSFSMTAAQLVAHAFSVKNIIPNVSSAMFRKPVDFSGELESLWEDMRLCGDWAFYLEILKGGCLFYTPEVTNFYRVHASSTSLKIQKEPRYYEEHERIARFIARNYKVPVSSHEAHRKQLEEHYLSYFGGKDKNDVGQWFRMEEILGEKRRPNVLMCLFSMSIGGGETFPLVLANELKREGIPVTVLDFQMSEHMPGIRSKLSPDVPYVRLKETEGLVNTAFQFMADIAHSHHGSVDEAVHYAIPYLPELRQVITLHGMYESIEEKYLGPLLDKVRETCHTFVYIADKNLLPFREYGGFEETDFIKIGNGLDFSVGTPIPRPRLGLPEDAFVLCVVSRAIPEKGWQGAIDAVMLARKSAHRDIHLLLVGGGEVYDRLLGHVPDCIHLMGFQSNVRDYFATADMGLLPSEFKGESFPLMIIDCLFCGKPVIVSNLGESGNQLLDEKGEPAGVVFDLKEDKVPVEELAHIIQRVADDAAYYGTLRGRVASASQKFRMERVAGAYIGVYDSVLHAPRE